MTDRLDVAMRYRPANRDIRGKITAGTERHSVDFVVNGLSLFRDRRRRDGHVRVLFPGLRHVRKWTGKQENEHMAKYSPLRRLPKSNKIGLLYLSVRIAAISPAERSPSDFRGLAIQCDGQFRP